MDGELIIAFELGISKNLEIDYNCRCVQRKYFREQEFSQIGEFKRINFTLLFTLLMWLIQCFKRTTYNRLLGKLAV